MYDVKFLKEHESWPGFVCPVKSQEQKHIDREKEIGLPRFIYATGYVHPGKPVVILGNMFDVVYWVDEVPENQKFVYDSFESLVQDGWMVD